MALISGEGLSADIVNATAIYKGSSESSFTTQIKTRFPNDLFMVFLSDEN